MAILCGLGPTSSLSLIQELFVISMDPVEVLRRLEALPGHQVLRAAD